MKILLIEDSLEKEAKILGVLLAIPGVKREDIATERAIIGAKRWLLSNVADLMILDVQIPQREGEDPRLSGGVELLEGLRASTRYRMPPHVIGLSAYDSSGSVGTSFAENTSVVVKYDPRDLSWEKILASKVEQILSHEIGKSLNSVTAEARHYVVLVHGIRTHANWAEMVGGILSREGMDVMPIRYGYFDVFKFLCPIFTREGAIRKVIREIRDLRAYHPNAKISVIAHSFGTYSIYRCLKNPEIRFHRIIFCGSIVPDDFRRMPHSSQLSEDPILNDCGTKDIWPPLAKSVTWGFGASGTFGFGTVGIRDRFNEYTHSDYFDAEFVRGFWLPFLLNGTIHPTDWEARRIIPSWWMSLPSWFPLRYLMICIIIAGVFVWFR